MIARNDSRSYRWSLSTVALLFTLAMTGADSRTPLSAPVTRVLSPPVISISSIVTMARGGRPADTDDYRQVAIHEQVVSDLVQNYECYLVNRSRAYDIAVEEAVGQMSAIDDLRVPPNEIVAADYVIAAHFSDSPDKKGLEGFVFSVDLGEGATNEATRSRFDAPGIEDLSPRIADTIASLLSLPKRRNEQDRTAQGVRANLTWVVMPFVRLDTVKPFEDEGLALSVEEALQTNRAVGRLVDRASLEDVLREHKIWTGVGATETLMSKAARLLKADRMVLGSVARFRDLWRIDLHLVDTDTALVLNARWANCASAAELGPKAAQLAIELAQGAVMAPVTRTPTAQQRRREAEFFLSAKYYPYRTEWSHNSVRTLLASREKGFEAAYLLDHDDPAFVYKTVSTLANELREYREGFLYEPSSITRRAARLMNDILKSLDRPAEAWAPLVLRAEAMLLLDDPDEALRLLEQHSREQPEIEQPRLLLDEGWCYLKENDPDRAQQLLDDALKTSSDDFHTARLRTEIAKHPASPKADKHDEYQRLGKLIHDGGSLISPDQLDHYLDLARLLEGPEKTLEIIAELQAKSWKLNRLNDAVALAKIYCYQELGQDREAAIRSQLLLTSLQSRKYLGDSAGYVPTLTLLLKDFEQRNGPVQVNWCSAAQVRTLPPEYGIYMIPVGDVPSNVVAGAASEMGKFLGTTVPVLPPVPVPDAAKPTGTEVDKKAYFLKTDPLLTGLMRDTPVPRDALFVVFVTKEEFLNKRGFEHQKTAICSPYFLDDDAPENPVVISYNGFWWNGNDLGAVSREIAWKAVAIFRSECVGKKDTGWGSWFVACPNYPCIYSMAPPQLTGYELLFSMCPACQEQYRKADLESIHMNLIRCLQGAGSSENSRK